MRVGIFPLAGKPVHFGHWRVIERASNENDDVVVLASSGDRSRPGESQILGIDMETIWHDYLAPIAPANVEIELTDSPVTDTYDLLYELEDDSNVELVSLYAGAEDMDGRFSNAALHNYVPSLFDEGRIRRVVTERFASGTEMRRLLTVGDKGKFEAMLPPLSPEAKDAVWELLRSRITRNPTLSEVMLPWLG